MALTPLSELTLLTQSLQPFTGLSVNAYTNDDEKDDDVSDLITEPKLQMQKQLIEELFSQKEKREEEPSRKGKENDSVIISARAVELYNEEYAHLVFENESEQFEFTYERVAYLRIEQSEIRVEEAEPLVIDLNGNGIELTDVRRGEGVSFDITGDGKTEQVSWVSPDDGLLVYDRNGNGVIDSGKELFGDQHGAADGFEELAKFDSDKNGTIDRNDSVFSSLYIWQDRNQNGYSEANELKSLDAYGIETIDLEEDNSKEVIAGNRVEGYSEYRTAQSSGRIGEVYFNYYA